MTGQLPVGVVGTGESRVSTLWLDEFGRLTSHVLHGLRNGLQGVGINLEVIRSRTEHGAASSGDLRSFAMNASRQFEEVSAQVEALAFLSKEVPGAGGAEVDATIRAIATLLNAGGKGKVSLVEVLQTARAAVSPMAARLILTHMIMAASKAGANVTCAVRSVQPVAVELLLDPAVPPVLDEEVLAVAQALHIRIVAAAASFTLTFPTTLSSDTVLV